MKSKLSTVGLMVGVGVVVWAALAVAQSPWPDGPEGLGLGFGVRSPAGAGLGMLLSVEGVEAKVVNTAQGVDILVTVDAPERVEALRRRVEKGMQFVDQLVDIAREQAPRKTRLRGAGSDAFSLLVAEKVKLNAAEIENGMAISVTTEDPEVVKELQEQAPGWLEEAGERREWMLKLRRRGVKTTQAVALIGKDEVKFEIVEIDNGIAINITSEDPELAQQIKEKLPAYLKWQKAVGGAARRR